MIKRKKKCVSLVVLSVYKVVTVYTNIKIVGCFVWWVVIFKAYTTIFKYSYAYGDLTVYANLGYT